MPKTVKKTTKKTNKKTKKKTEPIKVVLPAPIIVEKLPPKDFSKQSYMLSKMTTELDRYNKELLVKIQDENSRPIEFLEFKKVFFPKLDQLIVQINNIIEPEQQALEIERTFDWFHHMMEANRDLQTIAHRTEKSIYEIIPDKGNQVKSPEFKVKNYPETFEFEHRTGEVNLEPPKDKLKTFKTHHVRERNQPIATNERLLSATSSLMNSTNYNTRFSTKIGFYPNDQIQLNAEERMRVDNNRMVKSSYGFFKPPYEHNFLQVEKRFLISKHREVAEKRHEEEREQMLKSWGMAKGNKQENSMMCREIKKAWKGKENEFEIQVKEVENDYDKSEDEIEADDVIEAVFVDDADVKESERGSEPNKKLTKNSFKSKVTESNKESMWDKQESSVRDKVDIQLKNRSESKVVFEINEVYESQAKQSAKVDISEFGQLHERREVNKKIDAEIKVEPLRQKKEKLGEIFEKHVVKNKLDIEYKIPSNMYGLENVRSKIFKARVDYGFSNDLKVTDRPNDGYLNRGLPLSNHDLAIYPANLQLNRPRTTNVTSNKVNSLRQIADPLARRERLNALGNKDILSLTFYAKEKNIDVGYNRLKSAYGYTATKTKNQFYLPVMESTLMSRPDDGMKKKKLKK